ncbi:MAG: ABC transporter permease [Myxococcota bacterium]
MNVELVPLFGAITWAELRKLLSRPIAKVGLVVLAAIGLLGPLGLSMLANAGVTVNGGDLGANLDVTAANAVRWSLYVRNLFAIHILLTVLAALSVAGEFQSHSLREDLVRPVPRSLVLLAKWIALAGWAFAGLVAQLVVAVALGAVLHPWSSDDPSHAQWGAVLLGCAVSWLSEVGYAAVVLAAAVVFRSVAATLGSVFLLLVFERVADWTLTLVGTVVSALPTETNLGPFRYVVDAAPFLPSSAWAVWSELATGAGPSWQPWVALAVYTALAVVVADRWFARVDVP